MLFEIFKIMQITHFDKTLYFTMSLRRKRKRELNN